MDRTKWLKGKGTTNMLCSQKDVYATLRHAQKLYIHIYLHMSHIEKNISHKFPQQSRV